MENKKNIGQVEDYYDAIHRKTWLRRTASFIGGATIGVIAGAAMGLVAALVPSLLVAAGIAASAPALTLLAAAQTVALFAGTGGLLGFAALAAVGSDAGAIAAGLEEKERREKGNGVPAASPSAAKETKPDPVPRLFKWRVAVLSVPLMAAFGALLAFAPGASLAGAATLGFPSGSAAAIASSAAIFGTFGTFVAQPFAYYTHKLSNFYKKMITGQLLGEPGEKLAEKAASMKPPTQPEPLPTNEPEQPARRFAAETTRFSLQGMIEKTREPAAQDVAAR